MRRETKLELATVIIDAINDGELSNTPVSDIHNKVFNNDYFITGRFYAEKWLIENGGVFCAIGEIENYELENFGQVDTDLSDPEKVCNMYVYILGEEIINDLNLIRENWDEITTDEMLQDLKFELESL